MALRRSVEVGWMIREVGVKVRQLRTMLGLSQDQLARLAGTSQGAVSRVESGKCLSTPLVTYVRLLMAITRELRPVQGLLAPEAKWLLDLTQLLIPFAHETQGQEFKVFNESSLARLLRAYMLLGSGDRTAFAALAVPIAQALDERVRPVDMGDALPVSHAKGG